MKIGIDARLMYQTGVGRYIRNLLNELALQDEVNTYVIFLGKDAFEDFVLPSSRWEKRLINVHWHTVREQMILPFLYLKENLDILHVPYFTAPIFYPKRFLLTIHDLTILHHPTGKATKLPLVLYYVKWIAYFILLWIGVRRATHIFAVSKTTKNDIQNSLKVQGEKVTVTYEGFNFPHQDIENEMNQLISSRIHGLGNYVLYVGNAYPHKNLDRLLEGFIAYRQKYRQELMLVMVGREDIFYTRLRSKIGKSPLSQSLIFWGEASDYELTSLYKHARALIFPSLSEGFGLPAFEAFSFGCPVICSDIPVFRELLGLFPVYIDPINPQSIADAIDKVICNGSTVSMHDWKRQTQKFKWNFVAKTVLQVYTQIYDGT